MCVLVSPAPGLEMIKFCHDSPLGHYLNAGNMHLLEERRFTQPFHMKPKKSLPNTGRCEGRGQDGSESLEPLLYPTLIYLAIPYLDIGLHSTAVSATG